MVDYGITRGGTITGPVTIRAAAPAGALLHVINTSAAPTDHSVILEAAASGDRIFGILATGDTQDRFNMRATGLMNWGPGNGAVDVNLFRSGAANLETQDYLVMPNGQSNADFAAYGGAAKSLAAGTAGGGVSVAEGANARSGTLVLTGATPVVVANTSITATTRIQLTHNVPGGTPAFAWVSARSAGVSFTVTGTAGDTSTLAYFLVEPF